MTNEEARRTLKSILFMLDNKDYSENVEDAINLAIKALEETDKIEESNFSTEQYKADLQCAYDCGYNSGYADAMNDIAESEDAE